MEHVHGPNCGCAEYVDAEKSNDLLPAIDVDKIRCLNEEVLGSGKTVFKDYDNRFDKTKFVASDCDGELLFVIPFVSQVKIRAITVIAKGEEKFPNKMRLFTNVESVGFSITEQVPVQEFTIPPNLDGQVSNSVRMTKFSNVHKLIIHLKNESEERIEVSYIRIQGEDTKIKRQHVEAVYEVQPNEKKNSLKDFNGNSFGLS